MALLSRKGLLAIAAVIDPVLQALVREGILKGIRGPRGGYELARERKRITADEILRAAGTIEDEIEPALTGQGLVNDVVRPAVVQAEKAFATALGKINIEELARKAEPFKDIVPV